MTTLSVISSDLHFDYNEKTQVFEGHNLHLEIDENQPNKLYGIIGPSGTGKTTLISILGGQLKPTKGNIFICGTDIYDVNDLVRRQLITMQMQTATSLRGELKYNLLFGLPEEVQSKAINPDNEVYDDDYLIEVLQKVGLWGLFKDKDGLKTLIGEGGLNLSGGQRQRLNFAGLYLRAKYFKAKLILIDEPTSSLDEISEKAITGMINELAGFALTLVVAHRLKTLDEAVAILDSSLIASSKEMKFHTRSELLKESQYYRDLMEGKAQLDD
jgi:ABC-type multidrug transport system fused ATPase/permease subunit